MKSCIVQREGMTDMSNTTVKRQCMCCCIRIVIDPLNGVKKAQEANPGTTSRFGLAVTVSFGRLAPQILLTSRRAVRWLASKIRHVSVPKIPCPRFLRDSLSGPACASPMPSCMSLQSPRHMAKSLSSLAGQRLQSQHLGVSDFMSYCQLGQ